jgi:hypothetical protein
VITGGAEAVGSKVENGRHLPACDVELLDGLVDAEILEILNDSSHPQTSARPPAAVSSALILRSAMRRNSFCRHLPSRRACYRAFGASNERADLYSIFDLRSSNGGMEPVSNRNCRTSVDDAVEPATCHKSAIHTETA